MSNESRFPSLHHITGLVAWAYLYAPADRPLNPSHRLWVEFYPLSEWFRDKIVSKLSLSDETTWEDIYRISGWLVEEEYETEEKFWEAYRFGEATFIEHKDANKKCSQLREVKRWIVDRG